MPIEIQQPGLAGLYGAAATLSKAEKEAQRKEEIQEQRQYQTNMKMLDAQLDLEMYERSKRWEIDKMELRSQMDFQREEQKRQRKLDDADNAIQQIDKEVLAGRMTEQEAYPLKLNYEMNKLGVDAPTSLLPTGDEEERYGVRPYYLEPEFERDYPELAEAKKREVTEGRTGTVPYYLDPEWLRANRDIAMMVLESKGIMLEEDEIDAMIRGVQTETPLAGKQLDIGVQRGKHSLAGQRFLAGTELPTVTSDAEYDALPSGTEFVDGSGKRWRKP